MYPVEFILILLFVMSLQAAGTVCRRVLQEIRLFPEDASLVVGFVSNNISWVMAVCVLSAGVYAALALTQKDAETYSNSGLALASREKISESVPWFQKALKVDPESLQAKSNLAIAYVKLEKFGEGVPLLREIVRARPGDANNNYLLGIALAMSGSHQEGINYLQDALRINPNHENARNALNMLIQGGGQEASQLPAN